MGDVRDELEALLGPEDLDAECPAAPSPLRRPEPRRLPIAEAARQCAPGQVIAAQDDGTRLAVARLESGTIVALEDLCPHDGGLLSDGFVEGETLVCARHGWEFDGHTGQCLARKGLSVPCHPRKLPHI